MLSKLCLKGVPLDGISSQDTIITNPGDLAKKKRERERKRRRRENILEYC